MESVATESSIDVLSANRCEPGSFPLAAAKLPTTTIPEAVSVVDVAKDWVELYNRAIKTSDFTAIDSLFLEDCYWRDQLCLAWDLHTLHGSRKILEFFQENGCRIKALALDQTSELRSPCSNALDADDRVQTIRAFLTVDTDIGRGAGVVRLVQEDGNWKVFTLLTFLKEIKGHEETIGRKRPYGVLHGEHTSRKNWLDRRAAEQAFTDEIEPTVLIVGAGQAGLSVAARLKMLGVVSLIIDREVRIGDNWRKRYHQLVLHDPVWFDHLPYLPFPESWPVFTPKDKLGDWFESYVTLLELNAWTQTTISGSSWDEATKKWTVSLDRIVNGNTITRVLHPKHVIQATGHSGEPNFPSYLPGLSTFAGSRLIHSSAFPGAVPSHGEKKRAIVVGCCNSGHDIAQDFYENGYAVTMIQRSSTFVISSETNLHHLSASYSEDAPPTEDADMLFHSIPNPVVKRLNVDMTATQNETDEKLFRGLEAAGFQLDKGPDESGLWMKYLQRGGGYYLDVGCSDLIVSGKIKIKQGCSITSVVPNGLVFSDGQVIEADEVVFATGYLNMRSQCRKIFGDEIADNVSDVWGFDAEGELRTMWRKTGHPGFWFMGGNLALCRWYSRVLALQIKGLEEGICNYDDL